MCVVSTRAPKWPLTGPKGPAGAILGHFWSHFGAQVPTTLTNVSYGAQMGAFTASFCAMLAVF